MKKVLFLFLCSFATLSAQKSKDRNAIKKMCGCFEVTFRFAETFAYSNDSLYTPSKTKIMKGLEWATLITDEKNKISIQHLLVIDMGGDEPFIQKHWRQDWLYQNRNFYDYAGENIWNYSEKSKKAVKKQWTQKVYQVDDSPRYEGTGYWVHLGDKHYWESTANAPLPRREYTQRIDYNITHRRNRHEITKEGWVHDQDNDKINVKKDGSRTLIAQEKGLNTYKRVPDEKCKAAKKFWVKNGAYWAQVRTAWDDVFARKQNLKLKKKVGKKKLMKLLWKKEADPNAVKESVAEIINNFAVKP